MTAMVADARRYLRFTLAYAGIALRDLLAYRVDLFVKLAGYPARLIMAYFLWRVLLQAQMVQGYGFRDLLTYYVLTYFATQMYPFVRMAREVRNEIYSGDITVFLARGVPHSAVWIGRFAAAALAYAVLVAPLVAALVLLLGRVTLTVQSIMSFLGLFCIGVILKGQFWYLVGISSYFTEENLGTIRFYDLIERLLSGAVLPIFLFPDWARRLCACLPFQYTLYAPVQALMQGSASAQYGRSFALGLLWCIILGFAIQAVAQKGWRRFTAHGV